MVGVTEMVDEKTEQMIVTLKKDKHFHHVDWASVRKNVDLDQLKDRIGNFSSLSVSTVNKV